MLCVRDTDKITNKGPEKVVYETYIRHKDGGFLFSSRQFDTLAGALLLVACLFYTHTHTHARARRYIGPSCFLSLL